MGSFLDLASEGVRHPGPLVVLGLVVPDLLLVAAVDLGHDELDVLGDQFALLPGDRLALLGTGPDLMGIRVIRVERCRGQRLDPRSLKP